MKKCVLLSLLLALMVLLAGCGQEEQFSELPSNYQQDPLSVPTDTPAPTEALSNDYLDTGTYSFGEEYDPASEEDTTSFELGAQYDEYGNALYAGATPIPLDPIDMPTATPRPDLTFSYGAVIADKLGIQFEAPVGWMQDTSASDTIVLTDPNTYDGFQATLTIRISDVSSDYKLADVKTEVQNILKEVGQYNYNKWETTSLAARTLLDKDGYYANYRGEYYDGTVVRGRVMVALLDGNKIITVHMAAPGWYNTSYMNVVGHFRDTLKAL